MAPSISPALRWFLLGLIGAACLTAALLLPGESIAVTLDPGTLPHHPDAAYEIESLSSRLLRIGLVVASALAVLYIFSDLARRTR